MHLVPENNILFHNSKGQIALIIGPSSSPKDVKIAFKPYSSPDGTYNGPSPEIDDLLISNSSEKIIFLNIPKKQFPLLGSQHLNVVMIMKIVLMALGLISYKIILHLQYH